MLAPIVLFIYNRPWHTEQTLKALMANDLAKQSSLYIYADGPKKYADNQELNKINLTREIAKSEKWCKEVYIIESDNNKGLANSIINGVTEIVNKYGKVIILEDDIVTSKGFLKYMNEALEIYEGNVKVMHVSGYMYPINNEDQEKTFFCNILSCWGWATWKRAWNHINLETSFHLSKIDSIKKKIDFNIYGNADFYEQLILNQKGVIYSWAVKWYASWKYSGGYSLFPHQSLVKNIGHDGSGVHCGPNSHYDGEICEYVPVDSQELVENKIVKKRIDAHYQVIYKRNWYSNKGWYLLFIFPIRSFLSEKKRRIF